MNKKGFEFSFAWIFAIIIGAVIIFLAVYAAIKVINTGKIETETTSAKEMTIIFEPFESKLATGMKSSAEFDEELRLYNVCEEPVNEDDFGKQKFAVSLKSGFFSKWQGSGGNITITHKYIFSNSSQEGKKFYFFSKPFEMPFKVAELIFVSADTYCFKGDVPAGISDEILELEIENIKLEGSCEEKDIVVCFGNSDRNCDIKVKGMCDFSGCDSLYDYGGVEKENNGVTEKVTYAKGLIYGAIFSDKEIYDCNVKRLLNRLKKQLVVYRKESVFIICDTVRSQSLISYGNFVSESLTNNEISKNLFEASYDLDEKNRWVECRLW